MSGSLALSLLLAAASAIALNWGFFAQHQAASTSITPLSLRRPLSSLRALFSDVRWLLGFVIGLAGWGFYIAALRFGPLSLVQGVSAGGIGLLAIFVSRISRIRLSRTERNGVGLSMLGLLLLGISLIGSSSGSHHANWTVVAVWVGGSAALAGFFLGPGARSLAAGAGNGVAAGTLYAAGDVATKSAVAGGAALVFVLAVLACHGGAFVSLQLGFQRGGAIATVGVSTVFTNALPIAAGMLVFQERLPTGALGAARLVAFIAVVLGAALLTYSGDQRGAMAARPRLD